jgi:hypothetical protein
VNSRYQVARGLRGYLAGATAARAGDEMSGPALLLLGFAVTGRPAVGSGLLASVTIAGAVGGPVFGALLDRSDRPDRVQAWALAGYALGITAVQVTLGRLPVLAVVPVALISAMAVASLAANGALARRAARAGPGRPDTLVIASTLVLGAGMAATAVAPGWLTLAAVALAGAGEGPQLTALFAIRHRETPARMRGQVYTTAASLKIAGLAAGAALGGPLAGHSVTACLLIAAGPELCAAACGLLVAGPGAGREPVRENGLGS